MQRLFYKLGIGILTCIVLIYGGFILKPLTLGVLIAMIFYPAVSTLQSKIKYHSISYFTVLFVVLIIVSFIISIISYQMVGLFEDLQSEKFSYDNLKLALVTFLKDLGISNRHVDSQISELVNRSLSLSSSLFKSFVSNSTSILFTGSLGLVLSYFFSAYYNSLRTEFLKLFDKEQREKINNICDEIPSVVRKYLKGMSIVMLILAIVNSIIYSLIGLEYALFWGVLSGLMAFIPYLGSAIALLLPLSYSFISSNGIAQPILILTCFIAVQQIEGNVLTPKIVGEAVDINPLVAILFMIVSAQIWGIYGVFISIMVAGIIKIVLEQWKAYETIAVLMSEEVS